MQDLLNNKLVWLLVAVVVLDAVAVFGFKFMVSKVTDRVVEKLQKEYSPSPYGPGLDPDKVPPRRSFEAARPPEQRYSAPETKRSWVDEWESSRLSHPP